MPALKIYSFTWGIEAQGPRASTISNMQDVFEFPVHYLYFPLKSL